LFDLIDAELEALPSRVQAKIDKLERTGLDKEKSGSVFGQS
jgi:hypothetical protein